MALVSRRRVRVVRTVLAAALLLALSLALAPPTYADPVPTVPGVTLPIDAAGTAAVSGSAGGEATAACAAAPELFAGCAGLAGYGGFWLGKNVLGPALFKLFGWGSSGDNRATVSGFSGGAGIGYPSTTLGADTPGTWKINETNGVVAKITCRNSSGNQIGPVVLAYQTSDVNGQNQTIGGACNGSGPSNAWCVAYSQNCVPIGVGGYSVIRAQFYGPGPAPNSSCSPSCGFAPPANLTLFADWFPTDYGAGASWTITYTQTCRNGSSTATSTVTSTVTPSANGSAPGPGFPSCDSILPGSHIDQITATGGRNGTGELTVTVPTFGTATTSSYPDCTTNANTASPCLLDLKKNGASCVYGSAQCQGWTGYESQMTCTWGTYSVPIKWCEDQWRTAFDNLTTPSASASASATPGAALPTTGTNTDAHASPDPTVSAGATGLDCLGGFWSWDPIDWVLTPVKCALVWAFVPNTATLTSLETSAKSDLTSLGATSWFDAINGFYGGLGGSGSGCQGPHIHWDLVSLDFYPLAACTEPMATVATIFRSLITVLVLMAGMRSGLRAISQGFGFQFGMGHNGGGE